MMDWFLLIIGVLGFGFAGYLDLKTTEFPDWVPYVMIVAVLLVRGLFAFLAQDIWILLTSVLVGCAFLAFGLALYFLKQWGDGDAWLLGVLGFLFPSMPGFGPLNVGLSAQVMPYPLLVLFNFFIISFFYLIAYTVVMGLREPKIWRGFKRQLKGDARGIVSLVLVFSAACLALVWFINYSMGIPLQNMLHIALFPVFLLAVVVFVQYGKYIEDKVFKRHVPARKLRKGDVPIDHKWRVLTEEEVRKIKKRGGKVWIKEGVRLVPVFLITLLVNFFWGFLLIF